MQGKDIKTLIMDVQDSWIALFQALGMNADKKTAMKVLKEIIKAETASLNKLKYEKKEIFLGDLTEYANGENNEQH